MSKELIAIEKPVIDISAFDAVIDSIYESSQSLSVYDDDSFVSVSKIIGVARGTKKDIESQFQPYLDQVAEAKRRVDAVRKDLVKALDSAVSKLDTAEEIFKHKLLDYAKSKVINGEDLSSIKNENVVIRTVWMYKSSGEPLDPEFTTKDSLGFAVPDHKKIQAAVTLMKEHTNIRGVAAYPEYQIAVKGDV